MKQLTNQDTIMKLKPKTKKPAITYVEIERREITTTDVTYRPIDTKLLKRYFPSIYENVMEDRKLIKRGSKE